MDAKEIKGLFGKGYIKEKEFVEKIEFKSLMVLDTSGRDDCSSFNIGKVNERFFFYSESNGTVFDFSDCWGFIDELQEWM